MNHPKRRTCFRIRQIFEVITNLNRTQLPFIYQFLTRNYSIHNIGELDIVFLSKHEVVIVEVRSRRESHYYPSPLDSVDRRKQNKIYRTTKYLIDRYNLYDKNISFLVGYVTLTDDYYIQNVELIPFQ